jgi:hypothetical protein
MVGEVGLDTIYSVFKGYKFQFLTVENKALFDAAPDKYIPQFGGFCAWGMSEEVRCITYLTYIFILFS